MGLRSIQIASAVLLVGIALSCDDKDGSKRTPTTAPIKPIAIKVAAVKPGTVDQTVEVVGTLYGEEEAIISSKSSGRIVAIKADLGDRVAAGAVLAQIDPTDYQFALQQRSLALREQLAKLGLNQLPAENFEPTAVATVQRASVQTENARARLDRATQLYKQSPPLISEQEYADIETQFRVYQRDYDVAVLEAQSTLASARALDAAIRIAQQQLDDTTVRVPQSQQLAPDTEYSVAERRVSIGELVQSGTTMYRIVADRHVKLRAAVPERFASSVAKDQTLSIHVESGPDSFAGTVSRVSPTVDVNSRTFQIEAIFDNSAGRLRPGAFARGTIKTGTRADVTVIPAAALYSFAGLDKVFTPSNGKAVEHRVNVLKRSNDAVVVEGNLDGAENVIVNNLARLADGVLIEVEPK